MGCGQVGVGTCLARAYGCATTVCAKAFVTFIRVTMLAPINVFGTGTFH